MLWLVNGRADLVTTYPCQNPSPNLLIPVKIKHQPYYFLISLILFCPPCERTG